MASLRTKAPGKLTVSSKFQSSSTKTEEKAEKIQTNVEKSGKGQTAVGITANVEISAGKIEKVDNVQKNLGKKESVQPAGKSDKIPVKTDSVQSKTSKTPVESKTINKVDTSDKKREKINVSSKFQKGSEVSKTEKTRTSQGKI